MRDKTTFHFKQFRVRHDRCAMKVGTDGVLLGAWADVAGARRILDIGAGTGLISLMLAQRTAGEVFIDGVEIEAQDAHQATENIAASPWKERIRILQVAVQEFFSEHTYDLIVSNPPYFVNSLRPPGREREQARHTSSLNFNDLLSAVQQHLSANGKFNVILPYQEGLDFIGLAASRLFYCTRRFSFRSKKVKPVERWLLEFSRRMAPCEQGEIILYDDHNCWSGQYRDLTREFYLK